MRTPPKSLRFPLALFETVERLAAKEDRTFSNMIFVLVREALKRRRVTVK